MIELRATARLQLHAGFTLHDARAQVPYYAGLGISHLYLSPIGTAVPGSTHGYDNIDPTVVNPELGGEQALVALSKAAREHGMGLIADIVPNHMATHADNAWWWDVLRHGRSARHADWFD
ncbi:malto-oligosyltrehalose synthase, partial [Xanthomonas codiaei]